jgi:hypothetical protein
LNPGVGCRSNDHEVIVFDRTCSGDNGEWPHWWHLARTSSPSLSPKTSLRRQSKLLAFANPSWSTPRPTKTNHDTPICHSKFARGQGKISGLRIMTLQKPTDCPPHKLRSMAFIIGSDSRICCAKCPVYTSPNPSFRYVAGFS